jgi:hypothetical protein
MTIVFMTLFALVIEERLRSRVRELLPALLICGITSVLWWRFTDNLWPYVLVQFIPMLAIPVLLLIRPGKPGLVPMIVFYGFRENRRAVRRRDLLDTSSQRTQVEASSRRTRHPIYSALAPRLLKSL